MKLSEQEIREIIQEELKNISEQDPAKQQAAPKKEDPTGAGALEIKKAKAAMSRVKSVMEPVIGNIIKLGSRAKVNFAISLISPLQMKPGEINLLKTELDKAASKQK
jgi:hypothetical protein